MSKSKLALVLSSALLVAACGGSQEPASTATEPAKEAAPAAEERVVHMYNWSDYIAEDTLENFQKETGIRVVYDMFDSNDVLEAKLMSGSTGYDIVVPSLSFMGRQIKAGVFQELDRSKLSNYGNLDPTLMERIAQTDPNNAHGVPYLWGTTGIGYNVGKLKAILGEDAKLNSWDLVFKPEIVSKLHECGVALLDAPSEMLPVALHYLGENPNSFDEAVIAKGEALLASIRPHITYFHSSQYINDLANGDICIAVGWSGDVFQAAARAEEAANGVEVAYVIPEEGTAMWFDMLAMPKDAKNVDEAYELINYLLRPEVIAPVQNYVAYASGNQAALAFVDQALKDNPGVYPTEAAKAKLFTLAVLPPEVDRIYSRVWTRLKTGQ